MHLNGALKHLLPVGKASEMYSGEPAVTRRQPHHLEGNLRDGLSEIPRGDDRTSIFNPKVNDRTIVLIGRFGTTESALQRWTAQDVALARRGPKVLPNGLPSLGVSRCAGDPLEESSR